MVSMMDVEPKKGQFCDRSRPKGNTVADSELAKKAFKLNLKSSFSTSIEDNQTHQQPPPPPPMMKSLSKESKSSVKSPLSPNSVRSGGCGGGSRVLPHQTSLTSHQIDVVEDRKALRDALYQGIFHRHRRTIFAVGSFLRMLRSRNSQYNTIRSSSEGECEGEDEGGR